MSLCVIQPRKPIDKIYCDACSNNLLFFYFAMARYIGCWIFCIMVLCSILDTVNLQSTLNLKNERCENKLEMISMRLHELSERVDELQNEIRAIPRKKSYKVFYDLTTWTDAQLGCKDLGGRLLSLDDLTEWQEVTNMAVKSFPCSYGFWTSGIKTENEIGSGVIKRLKLMESFGQMMSQVEMERVQTYLV